MCFSSTVRHVSLSTVRNSLRPLMQCRIFLSDFKQTEFPDRFSSVSSIKFYANPTYGSRTDVGGETSKRADMTKLIGPFDHLRENILISIAFDQRQWHLFNPFNNVIKSLRATLPDVNFYWGFCFLNHSFR
jgi:hypothetical protein